jgi:hypothetical protein
MVRRGSTVRVRQRACRIPACRGFFVHVDLLQIERAVGMEPFMEPSGRPSNLDTAVSGPDPRGVTALEWLAMTSGRDATVRRSVESIASPTPFPEAAELI